MIESPWRLSDRADPAALPLADRHYNRQKIGSPQFVPPGRCFVLLTEDRSALWCTSWPFAQYVKHAWGGAWVNSLFRNEGDYRSSDLIRWAVAHTRAWRPDVPELGIVSFVDAAKTEEKEVPGWCYRRDGSGTTAEACIIEGFPCLLIDKDKTAVRLIRERLRKDIQPDLFGGAA